MPDDPYTVAFENNSTLVNDYIWHFGDGTFSNEFEPIHTYAVGNYEVKLEAVNTCGSQNSTQLLVIEGILPQASISLDTLASCAPATIQYYSSFLGPVDSLLWIFEGGDPMQSTDLEPNVTYHTAGTYDVQLYAANADGEEWVNETALIQLLEAPEAGVINLLQDGATAQFQIDAQGENLTYHWDFGDGTEETSLEGIITHNYFTNGTYDLVLEITNGCGTISRTIQINIVIDSVTEPSWASRITLYPNPVESKAWMSAQNWTGTGILALRWFDARGRLLKQDHLDIRETSWGEPLDLQTLPNGMYWLELSWEGQKWHRRLVKQ